MATPEGITAGSPSTWGDGAAHLSYMSAFGFRDKFPMMHPLFWGMPFSYAFGADLLGGLLVRLGMDVFFAYTFLGLVLSLVLIWVMWEFLRWLWQSEGIATIAGALFLWSGGLGWWWFPEVGFSKELTHWEERGIFWINTISSELLPQRAFLLGMTVGMVILWLIKKRRFLWAGLLTGLLAVIHAHTGIVVGFVAVWWWLSDKLNKKQWLWFFVPAGLLGGVLAKLFILSIVKESFFRFWPGWLTNPQSHGGNFIIFWLKNWGVFGILSLVGWWFIDKDKRRLLAPFVSLWIIANLWLFQPWDWDNSKIFTWVYLMLSGVAASLLIKIFKWNWAGKLMAIILFMAAIGAGFLDSVRLFRWQQISIPLVGWEEIELAKKVREETLPAAIFLTADQHNHFVPMLTGRLLLKPVRLKYSR